MDIVITEYQPHMAATLADMWNKSSDDWGGGNDIKTPGNVVTRIESGACIHHYVALDGEEAVGYCSLGRYFGDADALYIELLGVRPDYQGKKVGKALVLKCVERTIELGYPRLDIHTWPGNTNAVPLYKKCGYLWEDRSDSTHLVNFIPEILRTDLFKPFFEKADWYADSTRSWEIIPDGVKVNKFEVFGYTWEKDGDTLAVGYERTGRRIRLIETPDYKIELMAENHELAFGLKYQCTLTATNKTGKDLHVKVTGRADKNIAFDFALDAHITGTQVFPGEFFVGEMLALQDKWQVHPCLLADVEINGQSVSFGLGIHAKYPLQVCASPQAKVMQAGMEVDTCINLRSALLQDATVTFSFPENEIISFKDNSFMAKIPAKGKTNIQTKMIILAGGYHAMPIRYNLTLADGTTISFEKPFHQLNQNLTAAFSGENDYHHFIINGPWKVGLNKSDNEAWINHLTNPAFNKGWLNPPQFGKPYDDEFNLIKPKVQSFARGNDMIMEAEYPSEKFKGMYLTLILTLSAAGVITRHYRVENRGKKARDMYLHDKYWLALGEHTTFCYRGQFTQNHSFPHSDEPIYGIDSIDSDSFEENWIFEANPTGGRGFCWSPDAKPSFQWGNHVIFEINLGRLEPGQTFETPPVAYVYGAFNDFGDFRNYAMQLWDKKNYVPARRIEIRANHYNPILDENREIALDILNNRETTLEGTIRVSSDLFETQTYIKEETPTETNDDDDDDDCTPTKEINFTLHPAQDPAEYVRIHVDMKLSTYEKSYNRVLFAPSGEVKQIQNGTILTVDNGKIAFRVDPAYGPVCYSLTTPDGNEWLTHQHPHRKPFAWWNPFLGGIRILPHGMNNGTMLKEAFCADFAQVKDSYGNAWQGIRTAITIQEDDELRGAVYEIYFLTLPGLPLLCAFYRFINGTGVYRCDTLEFDAFLQPADPGKDFFTESTDKNGYFSRLHFGLGGDLDVEFENTLKLISSRPQRLYVFHGNKNNGKTNDIGGDVKFPAAVSFYMESPAAPGATFTSSPAFFLLSPQDFDKDAFEDFERLRFV
ncbi:MAG: GNAT family N-acetyltransferase [Defluviitaleaceae bacterium]|nr:GNAT family N-acetyltransferase [Defluviitaleaceae bacterium]MCL2238331.1 GNAT family N-acetyltransferase [Defluviitaleaceae bacterium]